MACLVKRWLNGLILSGILCLFSGPAYAGLDGKSILRQRCSACHNLGGHSPPTRLKALWARRGPDLFYAGDKYQYGWLLDWLQHPGRIRPAGMFYRRHIRKGEKRDIVDLSTLRPHVALNKADAEAVALALAKFRAGRNLVSREEPDTVRRSARQGEMLFKNRYGCISCHRIRPGYGGMSGPELYTAGKRLQPGFMLSYIKNPHAWDPKIWMPDQHVPPVSIRKLVNYLLVLSKENPYTGVPVISTAASVGVADRRHGVVYGWWHRLWTGLTSDTGMDHPDARLSHPVPEPETAQDNYDTYCVQCHAISGDGMGVNIKDMPVKPRNHTDSGYMRGRSDTVLFRAIKQGGPAISKSSLMPPWGDTLSNREISDLVKHLRKLCKCKHGG